MKPKGPIPQGDRADLAPFCLTGDNNIIHAVLWAHYTIRDPADYLDKMVDPERALAAVVDSSLLRVVGRMGVDAVLTAEKRKVADETRRLADERLRQIGSPLELIAVELTRAEAPEAVRPAFRDVVNAQLEMATALHQAEAAGERLIAEADVTADQITEQADTYEARLRSEAMGEASRFEALVRSYQTAKDVTRRRLLLETVERVLPRLKKYILPAQSGRRITILTAPPEPHPKETTP